MAAQDKVLGLIAKSNRSLADFLQLPLHSRNCFFVFTEGNEIDPSHKSLDLFDTGDDISERGRGILKRQVPPLVRPSPGPVP